MAHSNTILKQIASFIPRHDFEKLAKSIMADKSFAPSAGGASS